MRDLREMDEDSDVTIDPLETEGGDLSNQPDTSPD